MIAESLAVIGREYDCRAIVELVGFQVSYEPADDLVCVLDGSIIGKHLRRRLVQLQEKKCAGSAGRVEPSLGDALRLAPIARQPADGGIRPGVGHLVVEKREALSDAR